MNGLLAMVTLLDSIVARLRRVTPRYGFTVEDLGIVALIEASQYGDYRSSITGAMVAQRLHRHRQSVQLSLKRLEGRGLLDARRDDLGRATEWRLTNKGTERWRRLRAELARIEEQVFGSNAKDTAQVLAGIRKQVEQSTWLSWLGEDDRRMSSATLDALVLPDHPDNPMGLPDLDRVEVL